LEKAGLFVDSPERAAGVHRKHSSFIRVNGVRKAPPAGGVWSWVFTAVSVLETVMRKSVLVVLALCFLLCVASTGRAQNSNSGDIRGTVTDSTGALVPGVDVTVTNTDTGVINHYRTNSDGLYDTNSILPGNYTLEFSKDGFEKLKRESVPLQVGIVTVDASLKVGSATQEVEVSSQAPLLKTEDAQVATTLTTAQLDNLPNVDP
jgi:hypothetical protein